MPRLCRLSRGTFAGFAAGGFASAALMRFPAGAAEFNYKLSLNVADDHPFTVRAREAVAKIRQESDGQVVIGVFPNSLLGGDSQMVTQIRTGATEMAVLPDVVYASVARVATLDATAFAFHNFKAIWDALDGNLGKYVRGAMAKTGVYPFEKSWDAGFKQMTNSAHPINRPEDLRGLKIRVPPAPMSVSLYKALGASPSGINVSEMYTALQTHVLDGADIALAAFEATKYYEVQKYLSLTNHSSAMHTLLANPAAMERLAGRLGEIVERNFYAAASLERNDVAHQAEALVTTLKGQGMVVNERPDVAAFRSALQAAGYYASWRETLGDAAWTVLEKAVGPLR